MTSPRPNAARSDLGCGCDEGQRAAATIGRRGFLAGAGALGVAAGLASTGITTQLAWADPSYSGDTLVVLSLRGGFDGLSAVVPVGDPGYAPARPTIAVPGSRVLPLDGMFGLHPALSRLLPLYRSGSLAFVHAVGQQVRTRSHFKAMEEMESAEPGSSLRRGWIDRMVGVSGSPSTFSSVAMGTGGAPSSMRGPVPEVVMTDLESFSPVAPNLPGEQQRLASVLTALHRSGPEVLRTATAATLAATTAARQVRATAPDLAPAASYPDTPLGRSLREVARLVKGRVGLRAVTVDVGNWDMHVGLGSSDRGWMFNQLSELGAALAGFAADLGDRLDDVTLVTLSEFGRRVAENGSGGVDHGHGNLAMVMGGGVVGGRVFGRWPGLGPDQLDDGDLASTTDYRTIIAEILEKRCRLSTGTVFPSLGSDRLGLARLRS
ncbi:DUF1501 domain-containing protein [uncultured Friedmanniella sp.]|uniref:DUF1501 domain-containing protein n=1 Tax=uncultured Friedmanniella sp. TaxID=335381 RepID=UPI0035C99B0A